MDKSWYRSSPIVFSCPLFFSPTSEELSNQEIANAALRLEPATFRRCAMMEAPQLASLGKHFPRITWHNVIPWPEMKGQVLLLSSQLCFQGAWEGRRERTALGSLHAKHPSASSHHSNGRSVEINSKPIRTFSAPVRPQRNRTTKKSPESPKIRSWEIARRFTTFYFEKLQQTAEWTHVSIT